MFKNDDNLIVVEIGCWGGQIGKFLTNSNRSKGYFKNSFRKSEYDNRYVQYYGIDPNLQTDIKHQLMMINWDSPEMQWCRDIFRDFNNVVQDHSRMLLEKTFLNQDTLPSVLQNIKKLYSDVKPWDVYILFLTSIMKYHFKQREQHDVFMDVLSKLAREIQISNIWNAIYYLSNEVYGKDGGLYPFVSDDYWKLQIASSLFEKGIFQHETYYPEYTRFF